MENFHKWLCQNFNAYREYHAQPAYRRHFLMGVVVFSTMLGMSIGILNIISPGRIEFAQAQTNTYPARQVVKGVSDSIENCATGISNGDTCADDIAVSSTPTPTPIATPEPTPIPAPDITPPTVIIAAPPSGATLPHLGVTNISTSSTDESGIETIMIFVDNVFQKKCSAAILCSVNWNTGKATLGGHIIRADVVDNAGNFNSTSIGVTVQ